MTLKDLLEKVTQTCCGAFIGGNEDAGKPLPIYGNPNKKKTEKVEEVPEKQEQAPVKKNKLTSNPKETKYEEVMWEDLPKSASEAAVVLGFDKESWNTNAWLDIQDYWWEDLSEEQQAAATSLGWDITSWDNKYEELNWADLPDSVKSAAEKLGFTQQTWDDDEWPGSLEKDFDDLTPEQQVYVAVLGYNKIDWDES